MGRRLSSDEVAERCKEVLGDNYEYAHIKYINPQTPIILICKFHGSFEIRAQNVWNKGQGCRECSGIFKDRELNQKNLHIMFDYKDGKIYTKNGKELGYDTPTGYRRIGICGKEYLVHRVVFLMHYGKVPSLIDHIDRDGKNNKIENLRASNDRLNNFNKETKGYEKLCDNKYVVRIARVNYGRFDTEQEAMEIANSVYAKHEKESVDYHNNFITQIKI